VALRENRREDDDLAPAGIRLRINRTITVSVSAGEKTCSRRSPLRHYVVLLSEDLQPFVLGEVAKEALLHLAQYVRILRNLIQTKLREEYIRLSDPSLRTLESSTRNTDPCLSYFLFSSFSVSSAGSPWRYSQKLCREQQLFQTDRGVVGCFVRPCFAECMTNGPVICADLWRV
jgi:hypothetical protein